MDNFIFDLQKFADVTISEGNTYTLDGVTYTAVDADAVLNLDDDNKVSGIASGKVTAVISGAATSPTVTFDASDSAIKFTATGNGEILTVTAPFPIEFSKGEFTYKGNTLDISAGSIIAIVSEREGYTLRNEIFYEYGSGGTYTFTDTAFTAEGGRTRVLYTFTNGDNIRKLEMEGYGKTITNYAGQGFTLVKGSSDAITIGGYTLKATAVEDAGVNIYLSAEGLVLIPNQNDGTLNVVLSRGDTEIISGDLECTSGTITLGYDHAVTLEKDTSFNLTLNNYVLTVTATDKATTAIALTDNGISFTPNANDGALNISLSKDGTTVFGGKLNVTDGTITFDSTTQKFSFTEDTKISLVLETSQNQIDFEVVGGNASFKVAADESGNFTITPDENDGSIDVTLKQNGTAVFKNNFSVSNGSIILNPQAKSLTLTDGTALSFTQNEQVISLTATEDISATYKVEENIYYLMLDGSSTANISVKRDGQTALAGELKTGGVLSYSPETGTFGLTGANSSHGDGTNTFAQLKINDYEIKMATNDTTVVFVPTFTDGKLEFNFPNERKHAMKFTLSKDGQTTFENNIIVDGKIGLDTAAQEISLTKDTVITLVQGDNQLEITALDDASGKLTFETDGIKFAPNAGDGKLELNFVAAERKATIDITGAIILGEDNKISLENGTEVNFAWEDGANLKLTSAGSTGSIGLGEKGIKITSDDENLSIDLTTATGDQTQLSGIKGTIYYNGGTVSFDENSTITATATLGGQPVLITLETIGGTGYIDFNTSNGVIYAADTGAMKITWTKDNVESTFVVNSGSVQIGHGLFQIAEGTNLATDLKDFVPALYFTTSGASTYTINGQTITTTAENISMTATDDYMSFTTNGDAVEYDGMTFAGAGKVSLSSGGVVLGAGVEATGFGKENSFVLAEAGNVTADAKIFELSEIEGTPREIPMIITVKGAQDGFIFSRTLTKESEAYIDDALDEESFAGYSSPYIGKNFTEKFISAGDSSYRIRTDAIGLEEVIGISDGATVTGGASLADEPTLSYYNLVTDTEGNFTIGEKAYNVSGDSSVAIRARFEADTAPYASYFDSLNGTVSGDFTGGEFSINGGVALSVYGDTLISIVADGNDLEILGLDEGASLKVSAADTYTVNGTTINAGAGDFIINDDDNIILKGASTLDEQSIAGQSFANYNYNTLITGTEGDDTILNAGTNVTIDALGGNDYIGNGEFSNVSVNAGAGDDSVYNFHSYYPTLEGGEGNDLIVVERGHYTNIDGGAGNDSILGDTVGGWAMGGYAVINGGDGDDYIDPIESDSASIYGGKGNDTIITSGNDANINGGEGNDIISLNGASVDNNIIKYESGEGNDTIIGLNESGIISITAGAEYSSAVSGDDVILTVGENKITVAGGASLSTLNVINYEVTLSEVDNEVDNTLITGTVLNDTILNGGANVTINGLAGNDYISSDGASALIDGGAGMDTIINDSNNSTINGDYGDDFIESHGRNISISGSYGNDTLKNYGSNITIKPDGGNDYILNFGSNVLIDYAGGNDTISGLDETSTLQIGGGSGAYETFEGITNVLVFTDDNIVVLENALLTADTININGEQIELSKVINLTGDEDDVFIKRNNVSVNGGEGNDTIANSGASVTIDGGAGDDLISLGSAQALIQYTAGDGDDSIYGFNENSALKISGANYSTTTSGDDLIVTVGESKITLINAASSENLNIESDTENPLETLVEMILKRTEEGYPVIAGIAFHPTEYHGDEPTNYATKENWTIESADGLELSGIHYTPENSNDKWVVIIHGYGHNHKHMYPFAGFYLDNGYNVLMIDQRAAGDSEGEWLTMGAAESEDVALWTQEIARRNSNAKITLHGVSMGSATAMLAASRSDITNVTSLVEDCGYSNVMEIFYALNEVYIQQPHEVIAALDAVAKNLTGYYLHDAAPINSISAAKMPTLFITGDADTVVPVSMLTELYDASGAEVKEKFIVEDAPHGSAGLVDPVSYANTVFRFNAEADGEGWNTANTTDDISLRGTKYDDTISNSGANVTIDTGAGDDSIINSGSNVLIQYNEGDGNDSISGFNENSTLDISGEKYTSTTSGDDLILTVGDDSITLVDAASLKSANIIGTKETSAEKIIEEIIGDNDYETTITDQSEVAALLKSKNLDGDMALLLENKSADFSKADGSKSVTLTGGKNQDVKFNKEGYNVAVVDADTKGKKNISLGGGGDLAVVEDTTARVNITTGKGNDTIVSQGENVTLNLNKGGNTWLFVPEGKMTIEGYDDTTGAGFNDDYNDILPEIVDKIASKEISFDDGKLTMGAAIVSFGDVANKIVNFYDAKDNLQKIGFASDGAIIDANNRKENLLLVGGIDSTLLGGAGDDSIFAFEGSHVDAGAGRNYIEIEERGANEAGTTIVLSGGTGRNTIANFQSGFEDTSDRLFFGVNDGVDFKFDGTEADIYVNDKLSGVLTDVDSDASFVNILLADANGPAKVAVAQEGAVITVEDELADLYIGKNSAVDFTNYDGALSINLGTGETSIGAGEILFKGINQITAGSGLNTLSGSSRNETLTGNSEGITEFGFGAGGGRDVISNFNFDEDKIKVSGAVTNVLLNSAGGVRLQVGGGEDWLTIEDAQGKNFQINDFVAKVDRNIEYDDAANYFVATSRNATLTVGDSVESDAIIWLDNLDRNGSVYAGDIRTLDASNATVKTELAGNELNNTIYGGNYQNSLWGGTGGDDLLQGGAGKNTFFYALGNGSDTVSGTNDGDIVYLSGVTLENIIGADFESGAVNLRFNDGGKLTVNDAGKDVSFIVGEQTFYVNNEHNGFTAEK